ncbi:hypothetical protein ES702_05938 [subsurface metagenome]
MLASFLSLAFSLTMLGLVQAQAQAVNPITDPNVQKYRSRPDLYPSTLYVNTTGDVTPGYIFMSPYQTYQAGATIYDTDGEVVWFSFGDTLGSNVHDFQVCQYGGSDHLCFTQGLQYLGYSRGSSTIMDTNLTTVRTVQSLNGLSPLDQHEFNIVGNSSLIIVYHPERYDLSAFNVTTGEGWIMNTIFQDISLETGELLFEWSPIDHVALTEGYVLPNTTEVVGTALSATSPWDYFHMNSVDKDGDGNYLISARHTNTLYKINGSDGSVIWRCGGRQSDFEFLNGLNWSSQHDARWLYQNESTEVISLFDNASNGFQVTADRSAGYIVQINKNAQPPNVELLRSYPAPDGQVISSSQGSLQILNPDDYLNSNVFIGWGSQPIVTEHDKNGNVLYRANVALTGPMNYRVRFSNITLTPQDSPALYTYAQNTNGADTVFYMSWNGCTECQSWNIYGRDSCSADWILLGNAPKTGFETNYTASGYQEFGMVEAVDGSGNGLRNSSARGVKAFTPSQGLSTSCNGDSCQPAYEYIPAAAQVTIAETRSACAALPVETSSVSDQSSSSSSGGGSGNSGAMTRPAMVSIACIGLVSTFLLVAVL